MTYYIKEVFKYTFIKLRENVFKTYSLINQSFVYTFFFYTKISCFIYQACMYPLLCTFIAYKPVYFFLNKYISIQVVNMCIFNFSSLFCFFFRILFINGLEQSSLFKFQLSLKVLNLKIFMPRYSIFFSPLLLQQQR